MGLPGTDAFSTDVPLNVRRYVNAMGETLQTMHSGGRATERTMLYGVLSITRGCGCACVSCRRREEDRWGEAAVASARNSWSFPIWAQRQASGGLI